jgi:signal transduction histidine kinase
VGGRAGLDRIVKWQRAARPVLVALAAGAALHTAIAAALDAPAGGAAPLDAPGLAAVAALLAAVIVLAALLVAARRRLAAGERASADQAAALAAAEALLGAAPLASFRWRLADGRESYAPGLLAALRFADTPRFAALIELLAPEDTQFLVAATVALRADGTPFALTLGLRAGGAVDAIGRRVRDAGGHAVVDVVWIADAGRRAAALADAADHAAESALLRATLDALPLPVWRRGAGDLALVDCNAAYAAAVDAPPSTALAEGREIAAGVLMARGRALAERARATAIAQSESQHIVINGSRRLVEFTEAPLAAAGGIVGYARDFTDLENVQAELARHIAAHADVLENVATAIAIYGPDTRLKFYNTAFSALWRLEEEWLAGEPTIGEILERLRERRRIPEYADFRAFKSQQLAMFTSLIEPQEELLHLPDERTLRLVVSTHPFGGLTFIYEDVTDKLALERSYNTLIEVQRETLDNLYEAIAVYGSDGRLKLSNPAYGQIWNLSPEDLQGEPHIGDIVEKTRSFFDDGGDWPDLKSRIIARVTGQILSNGQLERRDGSTLQIASVPLPDGNVLLSYLDVTDSTRVQRALRERNEALETAGRLKSEFIANVSYELRTPLNAIIGFAEILTNQYFGELNPRQLDYSRGILDSSHRLLSLINDILDLATIEAGYMVLETERIDIHTLMASVLALTRERARKQNINLEFDCPPDLGTLAADERRLKQALFNLISNAIKFTPAGGTIRLGAHRENGDIRLVVADNGVGIPSEDQARVFEKFERGNPQARQSGAGLGLSLVKSFIELHGGRVEIVSEANKGTTITLYLPVDPTASETVPGQPSRTIRAS